MSSHSTFIPTSYFKFIAASLCCYEFTINSDLNDRFMRVKSGKLPMKSREKNLVEF